MERGEYQIRLGLQNAPVMAEQLTMFDMGGSAPVFELDESQTSMPLFPAREVPQAVIDQALYTAGNESGSAYRVAAFYMREYSEQENVDFLRREFGAENGRGIEHEGRKYAVWFTENGIQLAEGNSVRTGHSRTTVTWEQASTRILELLNAGTYLSPAELEQAWDKALNNMAVALIYTARDLSDVGREQGFLQKTCAIYDKVFIFPDCTNALAQQAQDDTFLTELSQEYHTFQTAYADDHRIMAAGDTRVNIKNTETSVYLLDEKVKLNKNIIMIPETTNVYTVFDSPIVTADTVAQPAVALTSPISTSISLNELRIDEQLKQIPWMCEHFEHEDIAYSFGTHRSIQEFINGLQAGSKNESLLSEGSDQFKIGVIFGQSPDREGLMELLKRCPAQLRTDLQLVSICDQILRTVVSSSDREHAIPASLKESFDRYEQGTAFGCLPVYAAEKFTPNVIHYNESMTVQGGRETYCLSVSCNNRRYILDHMSEEKCVTETEKLLKFAREKG